MIDICEDARIDSRSDRQIQLHFFIQVLTKIDAFLADLLEFNKAIVQFDSVLTGLNSWINGKGQVCQSCHQTPLASVI